MVNEDPGDDSVVLRIYLQWVDSPGKAMSAKDGPSVGCIVDGGDSARLCMNLDRGNKRQHHFVDLGAAGWDIVQCGPHVWDIPQSISAPGQLHAFVSIIGVPDPAPWAKPKRETAWPAFHDNADLFRTAGADTNPKRLGSWCYTSLPMLTGLNGKPWNDMALALVMGLRPSAIRVCKPGDVLLDTSREWRVTVHLREDNRTIQSIEQEMTAAGQPSGINGHNLSDYYGEP